MEQFETFLKNTSAVLDYKFDWQYWLNSGEAINTHTVDVTTGITKDSSSVTDNSTSVTVWLSGGTLNTTYQVDCEITTTAGRTEKRSILIRVTDR